MLFNSWAFICLVLTTLIVYYLPLLAKRQAQVLLVASFVFYAYDSLGLLFLLIASGTVNAITSYGARFLNNPRFYSTIGVIINLCLLALFKYGGLLSVTFLDYENGFGKVICTLPLPLGISFYTFSGISLVVDAYRGRCDKTTFAKRPLFLQYLMETLFYTCFFGAVQFFRGCLPCDNCRI